MDPITGAALIGGGAALLGGYINNKDAKKQAAANAAQQKEYAQHGIQWKVEDAKRAGISPEFALGASTHSFAPTDTGSGRGDMIADAGQNIARSVLASSDKETRELDARLKAETLRGMTLENNLKDPAMKSQLSSINRPGNPPFPSSRGNVVPGQSQSAVKDVALERTGQHSTSRHSEAASIPSVGWAETDDGGLMPIPSQDIKNRIEDQMVPESVWALRNLVGPNLGKGTKPPKEALPKGALGWRWSLSRQAWYPLMKPKMDRKQIENWIPENRFQYK